MFPLHPCPPPLRRGRVCFLRAAALLAALLPPLASAAGELPDDNRRFGTIFNNDADNVLYALDADKPVAELIDDFQRAVAQIAEARPGIFAQNVGNPDPVIFRSREATLWSKYVGGSQSVAMNRIIEHGSDPLQLTIDVCRRLGVPIVASFRMNAEDFYAQTTEIQDFGRQHRDLKIPGAHCLDPVHPVVFQHRMAIFREVVENYDIDGLEFDFRRWNHMISDPLENHPVLTRMVRETRALLDEAAVRKGRRRLILGARVGPSLATPESEAAYEGAREASRQLEPSCRELGLDVPTWVREELVDYLSPCLFWPSWPGLPRTREFVELAQGRNVGVYPTLFPRPAWLADFGPEPPRGPIDPDDVELLRDYKQGFCQLGLRLYDEGADGVSMFNWYFHLHLARMPHQWQAYYGYGMGGAAIQKYALSVLGNRAELQRYCEADWFWPPEYAPLVAGERQRPDQLEARRADGRPEAVEVRRVPGGLTDDDQPALALFADGSGALVVRHAYADGDALLLHDRGPDDRRWHSRRRLPFAGTSPALVATPRGTLLLLSAAPSGGGPTLHRSTDRGAAWQATPLPGFATRNIAVDAQGGLWLGVAPADGPQALWRSGDDGATWEARPAGADGPQFAGTLLIATRDGRLAAIADQLADAPPRAWESADEGVSWRVADAFAPPAGERLAGVLPLSDGRVLATVAVAGEDGWRQVVRIAGDEHAAVAGRGERWQLEVGTVSASGPSSSAAPPLPGNTVQRPDGSLWTAAAYRDGWDASHVEVLSWRPPAPAKTGGPLP